MGMYRFVTVWRIQAPAADVWQALRDSQQYPQWWPGMENVEILDRGAPDGTHQRVRVTTRSRLPYRLQFETIGREAREPDLIVVDAVGELDGSGRWELEEDAGLTKATYTWEVATTKRWMNAIEPFARPLFIWNHHVIMGRGGESLARHLEARLVGQEHAPPIRAIDWLAPAGLLAAFVGLGILRRGRK